MADVLLAVAWGDTEPGALADFGIVLKGEPGNSWMEDDPIDLLVELSFKDLALGFLHHWALVTSLPEWSATALLASAFVLPEVRMKDEDLIIEALWDASVGEPVSDEAAAAAQRIVGGPD